MAEHALEENYKKAIEEAVSWHTVVIDVSEVAPYSPAWGSGTLLEYGGKKFVLTCRHVLMPDYDPTKVTFLPRPSDGSLEYTTKTALSTVPIHKVHKSYPRPLPIKNRFYSDAGDDIALLELDESSPHLKDLKFYHLRGNEASPPTGTQVFLTGFSKELARVVSKSQKAIGIFPYFDATTVIERSLRIPFDASKHYLIDFEVNEYSVDPHGLSGCGVWYRLPSGEGNLWSANLHLGGMEHAVITPYNNETAKVLKVVRIEVVKKLLYKVSVLDI